MRFKSEALIPLGFELRLASVQGLVRVGCSQGSGFVGCNIAADRGLGSSVGIQGLSPRVFVGKGQGKSVGLIPKT